MSNPVVVVIMGEPVGKGRARSFLTKSGHIGHYTPQKTETFEGYIKWCASEAMRDRERFEMPVAMEVIAELGIPASWSAKKQRMAASGTLAPAKRPDLDNIVKAALDGCNQIIFADDDQVCRLIASKRYSRTPRLIINVHELEPTILL